MADDILCPKCGHSIDVHFSGRRSMCLKCDCKQTPKQIARSQLEAVTRKADRLEKAITLAIAEGDHNAFVRLGYALVDVEPPAAALSERKE